MKALQVIKKELFYLYVRSRNSSFQQDNGNSYFFMQINNHHKMSLFITKQCFTVKSFENKKNKVVTNKLVGLGRWKIHARNILCFSIGHI